VNPPVIPLIEALAEIIEKRAASAVLVTGNPKYVQGPDQERAEAYYQEIEKILQDQGLETTRDPGEPHTSPPPADLWLGHSRGADRLRFAPEGTQTIPLGSGLEGAITHPADLEHIQTALEGEGPLPEHYEMTPEMREELIRRVQGDVIKQAVSNKYRQRAEVYVKNDRGLVLGGLYPDGTFGSFGGGVEKGESLAEAARRELREESGVEVTNLRKLNVDPVKYVWDKKRQKKKGFRGSETHFFVGDFADRKRKVPGEESNLENIRWRHPTTALSYLDPEDAAIPDQIEARRKVVHKILKKTSGKAASSLIPLIAALLET
jgi:8-oxo-dGTP pyrophosphatase MutT (NUDIX family)